MSESDIAVVGTAARFPGARDVAQYWRNLRDGVGSIRQYDEEELIAAGVSAEQLRDPRYVRSGAPLDEVARFDAGFFAMSARDAAIADPQHRHFLECAWSALENAGHPPSRFEGAIGVFGGCGMNAYMMFNLLTNPQLVESVGLFLLRHTANDKDFLCTRVAYEFDLRGPAVNVQTACSTSLVAIHLASQSLLSGECDLALAGGVTIELPHRQGYVYHEGEVLSPDGHCRAFDHRSAGTVFGSGVGVVALRRLEDAIADGDFIHAVVKGSAINNDGHAKVGYLAPSVDGQAEAIAEALAVSGVSADTIDYVEAHGTGTPVGDPIEVAALTRAFRASTQRSGFCGLGSVKPNIGHLDTAAGVASFIKVVEALKAREIPPTLGFEEPNPALELASSPFFVNAQRRSWPRDGESPRRAGVSSLGVGGTNAHVILEEAPERAPTAWEPRPWKLFPLSARSESALDSASQRLSAHLQVHPDLQLADVAWTLQVGREGFSQRRVAVARDAAELASALAPLAPAGGSRRDESKRVFSGHCPEATPEVVFLFPGGGAQYGGMARGIYQNEPVFREVVDECAAIVSGQVDFDLLAFFGPDDADGREGPDGSQHESLEELLQRPSRQLPLLFSVEIALARLWQSWGIAPSALIGHSMGENTAACLAGVMSLRDALGLVVLRGRLFEQTQAGGMLSVPLPREEVASWLSGELCVAVHNAAALQVVAGPEAQVAELERKLEDAGVETRRIRIDVAAHSSLLDPVLPEFRRYLEGIELSPPEIPFVSNVTGSWIRDEEATDPEYWVRHLRAPVDFRTGCQTILERPDRVLLEVGPGNVLSSLARALGEGERPRAVFNSLRHAAEAIDDDAFLLGVLGRLWLAGVEPVWQSLYSEPRRRVPLPSYAFEGQSYWIEPGAAAARHQEPGLGLERRAQVADWFERQTWRAVPGASGRASVSPQRWLVFADDCGLAAELLPQLTAAGHEVVVVREGDAYYALGEGRYALAPEGGRGDYDSLIRDLAAANTLPDRVLHLWSVTAPHSARAGSSAFHHHQERGFYSLLFLAQALGEVERPDAVEIAVISNGMQRVSDERCEWPEKATLLGATRVIPRELAGVTCRSIDVALPEQRAGSPPDTKPLSRLLLNELMNPSPERDVAYRPGGKAAAGETVWCRWEQHLEALQLPEVENRSAEAIGLRPGGTYLVTGGLGGLGLAVAEHLARRVAGKLVLLSRRSLPERADWESWLARHGARDRTSILLRKLRDLEALGAEVLVLAADVANLEELENALATVRSRFGDLHGVFHAAGTVEDGLLQLKTQADVERVFAPKVHGTLLLSDLVARGQGAAPDFIALFSSTSALLGSAGQIDYAAANGFLNAYAQSRASLPGPAVVALAWGVWRDVGLAVDLAQSVQGGPGEAPRARECTDHPMLGERLRLAQGDDRILFAAEWTTADQWVLDEHRSRQGRALLPGTGYLELARAAYCEATDSDTCEIRDASFTAPLEVADDARHEVEISLSPASDGSFEFEVRSCPAPQAGFSRDWTVHAEGRIGPPLEKPCEISPIHQIAARCRSRVLQPTGDADTIASVQADLLKFGPRWQSLQRIGLGEGEAIARLELPADALPDLDRYALHPALLDIATGFAMELIDGYVQGEQLWVPLSYGRVRVLHPLTGSIISWVRSDPHNSVERDVATFDIQITNEEGRVLVEVERFALRRLDAGNLFGARGAAAAASPTRPPAQPLSASERLFLRTFEQGIRVDEGMEALERVIAASRSADPPRALFASPIPLEALQAEASRQAQESQTTGERFERPELGSAFAAPRDAIERALAECWEELLGVSPVGVNDDFFELGGHSLIAVRLFARIKQRYEVDYPISLLFEAPTIAQCAAVLREELGSDGEPHAEAKGKSAGPRYRYLVPLNSPPYSEKAPFFLVAGMFGNVLNLRHLGVHLGEDQPVLAIQARGLLGGDAAHRRFEDAARDYLEEVRQVQPEGPYFLGGFSGGGITAFEMARQLVASGEEVGELVMLDSIPPQVPHASRADRLRVHWRRMVEEGPGYAGTWLRNRIDWELKGRRKLRTRPTENLSPAEFRSSEIEQAFREALAHYRPEPYAGRLTLFRPPLDKRYEMGDGRVLREDLDEADYYNHWSPFVPGGIEVQVVPGDHDSMVLEPNVRVLAGRLRACLETAQARTARRRLPRD